MSYVNSHSRNWWLVGDIGGTNARFALYDGTDAELGEGRLFSRETLAASEFAKFSDAVESFLRRAGVDAENLRGASLAVACPLGDEEIHFTNSPWHFSPSDLQQVLRLQHLTFVNDFEALALSVPRMRAESLRSLRAGRMAVQSPKLILGPGTGLGVAGVFPVVSDGVSTWRAVPGKAGMLRSLRSTILRLTCSDTCGRGTRASRSSVLCAATGSSHYTSFSRPVPDRPHRRSPLRRSPRARRRAMRSVEMRSLDSSPFLAVLLATARCSSLHAVAFISAVACCPRSRLWLLIVRSSTASMPRDECRPGFRRFRSA